MSEETILSQAQEAIKQGERTRILFEILMSELGLDLEESTVQDVFNKLKETQEAYENAVKTFAVAIKHHHSNNGVS